MELFTLGSEFKSGKGIKVVCIERESGKVEAVVAAWQQLI